jgi:hypothetical protein
MRLRGGSLRRSETLHRADAYLWPNLPVSSKLNLKRGRSVALFDGGPPVANRKDRDHATVYRGYRIGSWSGDIMGGNPVAYRVTCAAPAMSNVGSVAEGGTVSVRSARRRPPKDPPLRWADIPDVEHRARLDETDAEVADRQAPNLPRFHRCATPMLDFPSGG